MVLELICWIILFWAIVLCAAWLNKEREQHITPKYKYGKRGEYYYRIEETQCGNLISEEKVIQPPAGAEIIQL